MSYNRLSNTCGVSFRFLNLYDGVADKEIHKQTSAISTADLPVLGTAGM